MLLVGDRYAGEFVTMHSFLESRLKDSPDIKSYRYIREKVDVFSTQFCGFDIGYRRFIF
jgi:hypothetical protein